MSGPVPGRLPAAGPRAALAYCGPVTETASWPRRTLALFVDWIASTFVVIAVIGPGDWLDDRLSGTYTMGVFLLETALLTALVGGSFGKLATGLRVVRYAADVPVSPRPPDLLRCVVRQVLVCLVVPPLVFKPDGRGLHDLVAGSGTVLRGSPDPSPRAR